MAYQCQLQNGNNILIDNQGNQTIVINSMITRGQQQQSSSTFTTGEWIQPPEIYDTFNGLIVKIKATQGETLISIQGNSITNMTNIPNFNNFERLGVATVNTQASPFNTVIPQMPPMQPMQPMIPMDMKLGNMQMKMNPMEMSIGDNKLHINEQSSSSRVHFCSQCGSKLKEGDRFCSQCGNKL